jgi:hypothetical protein
MTESFGDQKVHHFFFYLPRKARTGRCADMSKRPRIFVEWKDALIILHIQELNSEYKSSSWP